MPYEWSRHQNETRLEIWPYRSLPKLGFVIVISIATLLLALPAFALLGTIVLWSLMPFMAVAIAGLWFGLQKSYRDGEVLEELSITEDEITLTRHQPKKPVQSWSCNVYWATTHLHQDKGPVPDYVTLKGNGREVEIGAFLSKDERNKLYSELRGELAKVN
ncbi:MAG: DUF2244 domain-containing protein [Paracoccaceae bacterium]|nr:DUF2244 domain-containing protein [Paracoccaceae bacterium]